MKLKSAATSSAGPHQWQHDLPEDAKLPGAVDPGRIGEFLRQSEKELQQEDEKGIAEKGGDDERGICAQQTKVLEEHEGWIKMTIPGMSMVEMVMTKSRSRPGKCRRAKP